MKKENKTDKQYQHFENEKLRVTGVKVGDREEFEKQIKEQESKGIKITVKGKSGKESEFIFFASSVIKDDAGDEVLYFKFNTREKLVLYHMTGHPGSKEAVKTLERIVAIANHCSDERYLVRDIMDYIKEMQKIFEDAEEGKIKLKDGKHPDMNLSDFEEE